MQPDHDATRSAYALVAGVGVNGLGVLRSLARGRIPTIALDTDLAKATAKTRFGRKIQVRALAGDDFVEALLEVAGTLSQKPVLILTQEESVATVSAARERLADSFRFSMPSHDTMLMLLDKLSFQRTAEELKCPIPRSLRLQGDMNLEALGGMRFPCVVKPLSRDPAYGSRFAKAYKVSSAQEAADLWSEMRKVVREVIMQEWIEGEDSDVYFCLQYRGSQNTKPVSFVGRKICQWPPLVGGTASCAPAPEAQDELVALTDAFFAAVGFVGLCSMEYKRDRRDGKFYMVEPTAGRTDYQEEIATLNGVNIPLAVYLGELGLAPPPLVRVDPPHAWRDPIGEYRAHQAGATGTIARLAPGAKVDDAYFRFDDPFPYLVMKCEPVTRRFLQIHSSGKAARSA